MLAITLFLTLLALLLFSVPIGICLGLATMIVMVLVDGTPPLVLLARSVVTGADSFPLIAVPLFILAGDLMQHGGMSRRLVGSGICERFGLCLFCRNLGIITRHRGCYWLKHDPRDGKSWLHA